ncbi:transcriptional regulator NrdR family protein [Xanthomonas arboricola]|nr:transcriptional regulator NrdR family protein [Xanthomonas euroxanthea]
MKCAHCGRPGAANIWHVQACADGRRKRKKRLCDPCDARLNRLVLVFFRDPKAAEKMRKYRAAA